VHSDSPDPLVVPYTELSADALQGTDYGATEYALGRKVAQVLAQLERGEARIVFDPATESVDIVPVRERAPGRLR